MGDEVIDAVAVALDSEPFEGVGTRVAQGADVGSIPGKTSDVVGATDAADSELFEDAEGADVDPIPGEISDDVGAAVVTDSGLCEGAKGADVDPIETSDVVGATDAPDSELFEDSEGVDVDPVPGEMSDDVGAR